jgi:ribosomal protein L37AE/L43A
MLDAQSIFVGVCVAAGSFAAVVGAGMFQPRRWCPKCGAVLPRLRIPRVAEGISGGWTCRSCEARIDGKGRLIQPKT